MKRHFFKKCMLAVFLITLMSAGLQAQNIIEITIGDLQFINDIATDQRCQSWCWAAGLEMLARSQQIDVPQEVFVQRIYGCSDPNNPMCCRTSGPLENVRYAITGQYVTRNGEPIGLSGAYNYGIPTDVFGMIRSISERRPFILARNIHVDGQTFGHIQVVYGLRYYYTGPNTVQITELLLIDPYPDFQRFQTFLLGRDDIRDIVGTFELLVYRGGQVIRPGGILGGGANLPGGVILPGGANLPGGGFLPGGGVLPGGGLIPGGANLPPGATLPGGVVLPGGANLPGGAQLPGGCLLPPAGNIDGPASLPSDVILPGGTVLAGGGTFPGGVTLPGGAILVDGTVLPPNIVLPPDYVLPPGTVLSGGAIITGGAFLPGGADIPPYVNPPVTYVDDQPVDDPPVDDPPVDVDDPIVDDVPVDDDAPTEDVEGDESMIVEPEGETVDISQPEGDYNPDPVESEEIVYEEEVNIP